MYMHHTLLLVWIQSWQWLCHLKTTFWKYIIWSSPGIIFQCEFSCDNDPVIWRLHFENMWYSHHQASFFNVNSVVTVILSSDNYILKIYDMVITRHHFSMRIQLWQWSCHPKTTFWKYMIWSTDINFYFIEFKTRILSNSCQDSNSRQESTFETMSRAFSPNIRWLCR